MLRALWFLALVVAAALAVVWLIDRPGTVALDWQGYRIETSVAVLAAMAMVLAVIAALVYRIYLALRRAPARVGEAWRGRRRQKGYQALTRGMVAVAAGDADEARRQEKRAQVLLNEPPLTMLLSAQAAQLNGDDAAAAKFFQAMSEETDTEFLGVRGLLNQALARGDDAEALALARRAYRLRPKSEWVANQLLALQIRGGQWLDAQVTSEELGRIGVTDKAHARHNKAVLALQQGIEARAAGDPETAASKFKAAYYHDPPFVPAVLAHAGMVIDTGKLKRAADVIEKAWRVAPHPDLVLPYWRASGAEDGLAIVKATERLAAANAGHRESHVALARAALEARLWGEARTHLKAVTDDAGDDEARVCRLWAELEEAEHGDTEAARRWLTRAFLAASDRAWVCGDCGNAVAVWSAICGNCLGFDTFTWRTPPHVQRLADAGNLPAVTEAAQD
ncbi:MAG: heme biosynthesis HemY N-terminal domain-containing protein [Rhodospirillaceae bacterium]